MRYLILTIGILLLLPFVYAQDCNTLCLNSGYASGTCTDECSDVNIDGADDCKLSGTAILVIGSKAINTYKDLDLFIYEDKKDPKWLWIIKNIKTKASTNILNTNDETAHKGPILGVKNNFVATDIDAVGTKAIGIGGSFCFPNKIICIKL